VFHLPASKLARLPHHPQCRTWWAVMVGLSDGLTAHMLLRRFPSFLYNTLLAVLFPRRAEATVSSA